MRWVDRLTVRLRSLVKRSHVERELDAELQFHLDQHIEENVAAGMSPEQARASALRDLGALASVKEACRDSLGLRLADDVSHDVRYAVRQLRRSPGFTFVAILCLGLGIGVNTSIFGVLHSVLLLPMPVIDPDRLLIIRRGQAASFSYADYRDFHARTRVLSGLAASFPMESDLAVNGESEFVTAEVVSADYAAVLGVTPALGQWFTGDADAMAVISYAVWQRRFHLSPDVIGRRIESESQSYTIVGVTPRDFTGVFAPFRTDIWVPFRTRPAFAAQFEGRRNSRMMMLFGRLSAGATAAQASAELNAIDEQLVAEYGAAEIRSPIVAEQVRGLPNAGMRRTVGTGAALLAAIVALVLLIACVNIGNLLLARGAVRRRELAVRRALGATNLRLLRQLLTESLVLAIGGGISGVILARWTNSLLERSLRSLPSVFPSQLDLSLDWRAIAVATTISLATAVLCGFLPSWRLSRAGAPVTFKGEIQSDARRRRPLGVVAQVVMSLALLFVAGSFLEALLQLQATNPGFAVARRIYAYTFTPTPPFTLDTGRDFYTLATERLQAIPGVRRAAVTDSLPLMPAGSDCASLPSGLKIRMTSSAVDAGFFETMRIDVVAGRNFDARDLSQGAATVVVTESLARRLWPDGSPVGERVMIGCETTQAAEVIGVARDSTVRALDEPAQPHLYRPFGRQYAGGLTAILLETTTEPAALVQTVRNTLLGLGQGIRVYTVQPLSVHVQQSYAVRRWEATVVTVFGLVALLLAAIGLYGVIAYRVSLRTQEIGVRMALGASRAAIFREVMWHGLAIVLVGVAIGEGLTLLLTWVAGSLQTGIRPAALSTHVTIGIVWIGVALVACYVPSYRATKVDPMVALRCE